MIFVMSMVDSVGIDVYIVIFIMVKFQTLRAFHSSSVQLLSTIPRATQCPLCATHSYPIESKSINVENHKKMVITPSLFNKKMKLIEIEQWVVLVLKRDGVLTALVAKFSLVYNSIQFFTVINLLSLSSKTKFDKNY